MSDDGLLKLATTWKDIYVFGSTARVPQGYAATKKNPQRCHPNWFPPPPPSTVILGPEARPSAGDPLVETHAEWVIPIPRPFLHRTKEAVLVIACRRESGGLHSRREDALAKLFFNGEELDVFGLTDIPPMHDDYFYRPPTLLLPEERNMPACPTMYTWSIPSVALKKEAGSLFFVPQTIRVEIDEDVNWDIDYVGLFLKMRRWPARRWAAVIIPIVLTLAVAALFRAVGCNV